MMQRERGRRLIQFPPTILVAGLPLLKKTVWGKSKANRKCVL
jgi:hypothetical protein